MFLDLKLIIKFYIFYLHFNQLLCFYEAFINKLLLLLLQISYAEPDSESEKSDSNDPADSDAESDEGADADEGLSDAVISDDSDSNNLEAKSSVTKSAKQISKTSTGMCS